jgi:2-(3-amino-3-carboxypropyl)histidine synthase
MSLFELQVLYVFVEIQFDCAHLEAVLKQHFDPAQHSKLALMGTIQFTAALHKARQSLLDVYPNLYVPQVKPLSPGK